MVCDEGGRREEGGSELGGLRIIHWRVKNHSLAPHGAAGHWEGAVRHPGCMHLESRFSTYVTDR